jgi:hypothetical protein
MKASLPGDETVYEALDGEAYVAISSRVNMRSNMSLVNVVQDLMAINPETSRLSHLSAFPSFLVILGKCVCATAIWHAI